MNPSQPVWTKQRVKENSMLNFYALRRGAILGTDPTQDPIWNAPPYLKM